MRTYSNDVFGEELSLLLKFTGVDAFPVGGLCLFVTGGSAVFWVGFRGHLTAILELAGCR